MIQSIYTNVNNANIVPCGKKSTISSDPIPLLRDKFLSEYRTELEKAKVRKNLGIADKYNLLWGNIEGYLEELKDLVAYVEAKWKYSNIISEDITNVKEALDYAIFFISNYKANTEEIAALALEISLIKSLITDTEESLLKSITDNSEDILTIQENIVLINDSITTLNEALLTIDVDANILAWVEAHLKDSTTINLGESIEVNISQVENNALLVNDGLFVQDLSSELDGVRHNIKELLGNEEVLIERIVNVLEDITNILTTLEIIDTYLTELPEDTLAPDNIGGILQGTTVGQLKGKSFISILDSVLFPTFVRDLVSPTLSYNLSNSIQEVGSAIEIPILTFTLNDAGVELTRTEQLLYKGMPATVYDSIGVYTHKGIVTYDNGEYLIDNKGEVTNKRILAGSLETIQQVTITYPWYSGNENTIIKLSLIPYNFDSGLISFSLSGKAIIKLPGINSLLNSFTVNGGLGYLNVNLDGWTPSTEELNGTTYRVWTKKDSYSAALPHQINFILS